MQELLSFFMLYVSEDNFNNSLWIMLLLLYAGASFYMIDFYNLVKRKSRAETMGMMAIPFVVSMMGAAMAAMFVHVPPQGRLQPFFAALESLRLHLALAASAVVYLILWGISFYLQKERGNKEKLRWVLSGIPDYSFAALLLSCFFCRLIIGESPFWGWPEWVLWIYLYAVYFLYCKIILLTVGLFVRFYSVRIRIFRWKERKSPSAFLFRYYVLYQNAIFRNLVFFELGLLIPLTLALGIYEEWSFEMTVIMGFLYICGVFVVLFSLAPIMKSLEKFRIWGNADRMKESFCREYFLEEPVYRSEGYTVTRHFLVDEKSPAALYYWPALRGVGDLVTDKTGTGRTIYFGDGSSCRVLKEELNTEAFLFSYARKWEETPDHAGDEKGWTPCRMPGQKEGAYQSFVQKLAMILVFLMFLVLHMLRNS